MRLDIGRVVSNEKFVLEFDEQADYGELDIFGVRPFSEPVRVSGSVKNKYSGIEFKAEINAHCKSFCDRCLKPVEFDLNTGIESFIDLDSEENGDDLIEIKSGRFIELDDALLESLMFAYPQKVLCKEDCKGLCPECGADLNEAPCKCLIGE